MLKGQAKKDYQREYMKKRRSNKQLDPVRPKLEKAGLVIQGNRILGTKKTPHYKRPVPKWLGF